jgi:DNA repair protein RecO (recombination protein O)
MRWADEAIMLAGRPHGETSVIAEMFTREHGRTLGLVKGGRSRRIRPLLQIGNVLKVEWRARLDDQLGVYTVELARASSSAVWDDAGALCALTALAALLQVLPERDPHPRLYDASTHYLEQAASPQFAAELARFELLLLDELGFGLELKSCVATGSTDELIYVSPKSGQAVSAEAGEPYKHRLLPLPRFLSEPMSRKAPEPEPEDIAAAFRLTGHFLEKCVFEPSGRPMPRARSEFVRRFEHLALSDA